MSVINELTLLQHSTEPLTYSSVESFFFNKNKRSVCIKVVRTTGLFSWFLLVSARCYSMAYDFLCVCFVWFTTHGHVSVSLWISENLTRVSKLFFNHFYIFLVDFYLKKIDKNIVLLWKKLNNGSKSILCYIFCVRYKF